MSEIVMPRLSDSMEEGTIIRWLKQAGEQVERGDELVEIETDKATMTYESDIAGVLEILAQEGDTLPVGSPIANLGDGDGSRGPLSTTDGELAPVEDAPAVPTAAPGAIESPAMARPSADQSGAAGPAASAAEPSGRVKASPVARRIARERGVDLGTLRGSGPGGRIVKADVENAGAAPAAAHAPTPAPSAAPAPAPTPHRHRHPSSAVRPAPARVRSRPPS